MRIIRTCRDMGLATVAVYSECDRNALHVRLADEAHAIGPDQASESYLRIDKLIDVVGRLWRRRGASRLWIPGRERRFCRGVLDGRSDVHRTERRGNACDGQQDGRGAATSRLRGRACLVVPGGRTARGHRLSAAGEGGGRRWRERACAVVRAPEELDERGRAWRDRRRESSFGDDRVYFERLLERPRHIEVQLLGDRHGTIVPFVERECSIQRRHQKLIEETPSPSVTPALRERLMAAAAAIGAGGGLHERGHDRISRRRDG